jgi:hypothetical protein
LVFLQKLILRQFTLGDVRCNLQSHESVVRPQDRLVTAFVPALIESALSLPYMDACSSALLTEQSFVGAKCAGSSLVALQNLPADASGYFPPYLASVPIDKEQFVSFQIRDIDQGIEPFHHGPKTLVGNRQAAVELHNGQRSAPQKEKAVNFVVKNGSKSFSISLKDSHYFFHRSCVVLPSGGSSFSMVFLFLVTSTATIATKTK